MSKKFQQLDGSWDQTLAERLAKTARAVLVRQAPAHLTAPSTLVDANGREYVAG
jgi:hypothetical protein